MSKPLILVTNDDGITAPGILTLIDIAKEIGEVVVVAPDSPQSGTGHAITVNNTLFLYKTSLEQDEILSYSCSGTPVDCVKLAIHEVLKKKPDLCISGINHGSNSSINVIYSGTPAGGPAAGEWRADPAGRWPDGDCRGGCLRGVCGLLVAGAGAAVRAETADIPGQGLQHYRATQRARPGAGEHHSR